MIDKKKHQTNVKALTDALRTTLVATAKLRDDMQADFDKLTDSEQEEYDGEFETKIEEVDSLHADLEICEEHLSELSEYVNNL